MSNIVVVANGKPRSAAHGATIADFLRALDLAASLVIVEYNGEPLARDRFAGTVLEPGDCIEIAQMVGGG